MNKSNNPQIIINPELLPNIIKNSEHDLFCLWNAAKQVDHNSTGIVNQSDFINELYYKGERFYPKIPIGFVQENLEKILSKENMDKYFNSKDFEKFSKFLPECTINNKNSEEIKNQILEILNPESKLTKFNHPVELFKNMLDKNYFS